MCVNVYVYVCVCACVCVCMCVAHLIILHYECPTPIKNNESVSCSAVNLAHRHYIERLEPYQMIRIGDVDFCNVSSIDFKMHAGEQ